MDDHNPEDCSTVQCNCEQVVSKHVGITGVSLGQSLCEFIHIYVSFNVHVRINEYRINEYLHMLVVMPRGVVA